MIEERPNSPTSGRRGRQISLRGAPISLCRALAFSRLVSRLKAGGSVADVARELGAPFYFVAVSYSLATIVCPTRCD